MPTAHTLARALAASPEAAQLLERWDATQRAATALADHCRELAAGFDPRDAGRCELRGTDLMLNADSAAQAAKLRQAIPRLLRPLHQLGLQVYGIRIRVQSVRSEDRVTTQAIAPERYGTARQPSTTGAKAISELTLTLPTSRLREALEKLERTLARLPR